MQAACERHRVIDFSPHIELHQAHPKMDCWTWISDATESFDRAQEPWKANDLVLYKHFRQLKKMDSANVEVHVMWNMIQNSSFEHDVT